MEMWLRFNGSVRRVATEARCAPVGYNQPLVCGAVISPNGEALRRKVSRDMSGVLASAFRPFAIPPVISSLRQVPSAATAVFQSPSDLPSALAAPRQIRPSAARSKPQLRDWPLSCQIRPSAAARSDPQLQVSTCMKESTCKGEHSKYV